MTVSEGKLRVRRRCNSPAELNDVVALLLAKDLVDRHTVVCGGPRALLGHCWVGRGEAVVFSRLRCERSCGVVLEAHGATELGYCRASLSYSGLLHGLARLQSVEAASGRGRASCASNRTWPRRAGPELCRLAIAYGPLQSACECSAGRLKGRLAPCPRSGLRPNNSPARPKPSRRRSRAISRSFT